MLLYISVGSMWFGTMAAENSGLMSHGPLGSPVGGGDWGVTILWVSPHAHIKQTGFPPGSVVCCARLRDRA